MLWALAAGNFVIGTGIMMPAGMMNVLGDAFGLPVPRIAMLVWLGAIVMGVGAPAMAQIASRLDRRMLLVGALALYVVGHLASAVAPGFGTLLAARVVTVVGAAVFTPQAAAALGVLLPPHRRAAGVTFAFLGWSVAATLGMPLGSWLGATLGWRSAYLLEAAMALAAAVAVARTLPPRVFSPGVSFTVWRQVGGSAALRLALAVTVVQTAGQFTLSSFLAPEYRRLLDAGPGLIAALFTLFGAFGFVGNVAASRLVGRLGTPRTVALTLGAMLLGLSTWSIGVWTGTVALIVLALVPWGLGCFSSNSLQQARLIGLAPALAPATVALNSSGLYLGQAIGALAGSAMLAAGQPGGLAPFGVALMAMALVLSSRVERVRG